MKKKSFLLGITLYFGICGNLDAMFRRDLSHETSKNQAVSSFAACLKNKIEESILNIKLEVDVSKSLNNLLLHVLAEREHIPPLAFLDYGLGIWRAIRELQRYDIDLQGYASQTNLNTFNNRMHLIVTDCFLFGKSHQDKNLITPLHDRANKFYACINKLQLGKKRTKKELQQLEKEKKEYQEKIDTKRKQIRFFRIEQELKQTLEQNIRETIENTKTRIDAIIDEFHADDSQESPLLMQKIIIDNWLNELKTIERNFFERYNNFCYISSQIMELPIIDAVQCVKNSDALIDSMPIGDRIYQLAILCRHFIKGRLFFPKQSVSTKCDDRVIILTDEKMPCRYLYNNFQSSIKLILALRQSNSIIVTLFPSSEPSEVIPHLRSFPSIYEDSTSISSLILDDSASISSSISDDLISTSASMPDDWLSASPSRRFTSFPRIREDSASLSLSIPTKPFATAKASSATVSPTSYCKKKPWLDLQYEQHEQERVRKAFQEAIQTEKMKEQNRYKAKNKKQKKKEQRQRSYECLALVHSDVKMKKAIGVSSSLASMPNAFLKMDDFTLDMDAGNAAFGEARTADYPPIPLKMFALPPNPEETLISLRDQPETTIRTMEFPPEVEQIDMAFLRHFSTLWSGNIENFSALKILNLKGTGIQTLEVEAFRGFEMLEILDLSCNFLKNLSDPLLFSHLKSLKKLYLAANKLTELVEGLFINLYNLETLDLSFNQLSKLPFHSNKRPIPAADGVIVGVERKSPSSIVIATSQNSRQIVSHPKPYQNLKELFLNSNCFEELPVSLSTLENLDTLYLDYNLMRNLEFLPLIHSSTSLRELSLVNNCGNLAQQINGHKSVDSARHIACITIDNLTIKFSWPPH
ncbi:MAG: hypothetical protein LBO02_00745 [Holosporaceae bacterium]|jgi:Leucine-rich repeat (LRR) protein|nr:hypothetical protein [Holosporaceae bacterium]